MAEQAQPEFPGEIARLHKLTENFGNLLWVILFLKMRDLVCRQTDFLQMTDEPFPDRSSLPALAQVQFRDCFLGFLQTDCVAVLVVVLDDLFLVTAALRRHVGGLALRVEGTEIGDSPIIGCGCHIL